MIAYRHLVERSPCLDGSNSSFAVLYYCVEEIECEHYDQGGRGQKATNVFGGGDYERRCKTELSTLCKCTLVYCTHAALRLLVVPS
jgi:hypothetical protein